MSNVPCSGCAFGVNCLPCAVRIFRRLILWLESDGIRFEQSKLHLALASDASVPSSGSGRRTLGVTVIQKTCLLGIPIRSEAREVRIVRGLPTVLFQAVTLHELGHVWLSSNRIHGLPQWAAEGFGQLLAFRFVSRFRSDAGRQCVSAIEFSPDPVYGDGFRRIRKVAEQTGFAHFIERLRNERQLPSTSERLVC